MYLPHKTLITAQQTVALDRLNGRSMFSVKDLKLTAWGTPLVKALEPITDEVKTLSPETLAETKNVKR